MKLPEKIVGRNRIRDAAIVLEWHKEDATTDKIAEKFKLTQRRIEQILRANHQFVTIDKEWEKKKRIHWLKNQLKKRGDTAVDSLHIQGQLRTEIEGDKPVIDQSQHTHITYVWKDPRNSDTLRAPELSTRDSLSPS